MSDLFQRLFHAHQLAIMGIVNVTPDSFSDGGQFDTHRRALDHALALADAGADLLDLGGESTRPGSTGVDAAIEKERVVPVLKDLRRRRPELPLSIDTSKVEVARAALDAGVALVNDVTAGAGAGMFELVAERQAAVVLMHMRGQPRTMQHDTTYEDVVGEVRDVLVGRAEAAEAAGIDRGAIALDPGIGFGKDRQGNLSLLRGLPRLAERGYPLLVGASRKAFLGLITGAPVGERVAATLATIVPVLALDRAIIRVHDVAEAAHFRAVLEALGPGRWQAL